METSNVKEWLNGEDWLGKSIVLTGHCHGIRVTFLHNNVTVTSCVGSDLNKALNNALKYAQRSTSVVDQLEKQHKDIEENIKRYNSWVEKETQKLEDTKKKIIKAKEAIIKDVLE